MDVVLEVSKSDGERKVIPLPPGRYVIGRDAGATLRIPLKEVSRRHCELTHDGGVLRVRDLGSSNGTYRNGERVDGEVALEPRDVLTLGPVTITIRLPGGEPKAGDDRGGADGVSVGGPAAAAGAAAAASDPTPGDGGDGGAADDGGDAGDENEGKAGLGSLLDDSMADDSSMFDFDFDLTEDDENPQL